MRLDRAVLTLELYGAICGRILYQCFYHAARGSHIRHAVDKQHFTQCLVLFKGVNRNFFCHGNVAVGNLVLLQAVCLHLLAGIHIGLIAN